MPKDDYANEFVKYREASAYLRKFSLRGGDDQAAVAEGPPSKGPPFDPGGGGGDNGGMDRIDRLESRVDKIGDTLASIDGRVAVIESNYATKADLANAKLWIIVTVLGSAAAAQLLGGLLPWNRPQAPAVVQTSPAQPPIIINVPPAALPAPQQPAR